MTQGYDKERSTTTQQEGEYAFACKLPFIKSSELSHHFENYPSWRFIVEEEEDEDTYFEDDDDEDDSFSIPAHPINKKQKVVHNKAT